MIRTKPVNALFVSIAIVASGFLPSITHHISSALIITAARADSAICISVTILYTVIRLSAYVRVIGAAARHTLIFKITSVIYLFNANRAHICFYTYPKGAADLLVDAITIPRTILANIRTAIC